MQWAARRPPPLLPKCSVPKSLLVLSVVLGHGRKHSQQKICGIKRVLSQKLTEIQEKIQVFWWKHQAAAQEPWCESLALLPVYRGPPAKL